MHKVDNSLLKIKEIYWRIYNQYLLNYKKIEDNHSIDGTILIVGSARSGTTWLGDVCAKILNARPIFEPFIMNKKYEFYFSCSLFKRSWNRKKHENLLMNYSPYISSRKYISSKLYKQIENILKGKVRSQWTDRDVDFRKKYKKRVIKEVRANLMIKFIANEWQKIKIIWIIRNPYNVIKSQIYLSKRYSWSFDLDDNLLKQKFLIKDWLCPFLIFIKKSKTLPERLMHRWCIENYVPFSQKVYELPNVLLVSYERLVSSEKEWRKLFSFLGISISYNELQKYLNKPSHTSIRRSTEDMNQILKEACYSESVLDKILILYGLDNLITNNK
ncbi:hypothetical protein Thein_1756 [Thermodesulfatator indicus DSM 15286]|uniref:Sulfotransferase domain-containing protein n=1 Tax=Thermodesulfatator indicus (strain DSM 15286 / JCM 11887 / CIR29812) TaxID=667014 RepID=F8ABL4_THEID|nr:sulfotransferase domain-containing protein [Thermodesulfatator indicus]AEH45613.1 hypothetical protein Thein_1756 [Thermodesulfatator indicus DSM 15286]